MGSEVQKWFQMSQDLLAVHRLDPLESIDFRGGNNIFLGKALFGLACLHSLSVRYNFIGRAPRRNLHILRGLARRPTPCRCYHVVKHVSLLLPW